MKWIGIEETSGDPPSKDTEKIEWLKAIKETYLLRYPDTKNILENVLFCKECLCENPKWRTFEENASNDGVKPTKDGKKKRPVGTKVAKQAKADGEIVKKLFDNSIDSSQSEKKKRKN
jgi:hypothetical protein